MGEPTDALQASVILLLDYHLVSCDSIKWKPTFFCQINQFGKSKVNDDTTDGDMDDTNDADMDETADGDEMFLLDALDMFRMEMINKSMSDIVLYKWYRLESL